MSKPPWKPEPLGPTELQEKLIIESMAAEAIAAKTAANATTSTSITNVFNGAIRHNKSMVRTGFILGSKIHIKMSGIKTTAQKPDKYLLARAPKGCAVVLATFIVAQGTELALHGGNNKWFKVLHWAVETENHEMLVFALEKGADIEQRDYFGETALHVAASKGNISTVKMLLEKGADVNSEDDSGSKPLHYAILHWESKAQLIRNDGGDKNPNLIWLLMEQGQKVGYVGAGGAPLLHFAVRYKHHALIATLLKSGEDINKQDDRGRTALHVAAMNSHEDIVQGLLGYGADGTIQDEDGLTYDDKEDPKEIPNTVRDLLDRIVGINEEDRAKEWVDGDTDEEMGSVYSEYEGPFSPVEDPDAYRDIHDDSWMMNEIIDDLISEPDGSSQISLESQPLMDIDTTNQIIEESDSFNTIEQEGPLIDLALEEMRQLQYFGDEYREVYTLMRDESDDDT